MGAATQICRILTAILFLFSGFIKANDTIGFSYKLDEYIYLFGISWLVPASVFIAGLICILEIVLGFSLLIGWGIPKLLWLLLLLTLMFSALTFYSAYYNKVSDCGCFGDFMKLKPWASFSKDAVLLLMCILLLAGRRNIHPVFSGKFSKFLVISVLIASFAFPVYTYNYLPVFNFLPFKKGTDLMDLRTIPANATAEEVQSKIYFTFTDSEDKDRTEEFLKKPGYKFLLVSYDLDKSSASAQGRLNDFVALCQSDSIPFSGLTASSTDKIRSFRHEAQAMYDYFTCDEVVLKSMVRSNPGILLMRGSEIQQVWHFRTLPPYSDVKQRFMKN